MKTARCHVMLFAFWLAALSAATGSDARPSRPTGEAAQVNAVLELGKSYPIRLPVWNKEVHDGNKDVKLEGFDLEVHAYYLSDSLLGVNTLTQRSTPSSSLKEACFHFEWLDMKYYSWNPSSGPSQENNAYLTQHRDKVRFFEASAELNPLHAEFAQLRIASRLEMSRNDSLVIEGLSFRAKKPGMYRLEMKIKKGKEVTDFMRQHVYFECPEYRVTLRVNNEKLLHHISYETLHIPPVTSVFFEKGEPVFANNPTDNAFRKAFLAVAAARMHCQPFSPDLLVVYDETAGEHAALGRKRAEYLRELLHATNAKLANGAACELALTVRNAERPREWARYIKPPSEIAQDKFSQENRVVPIKLDLHAQREVFKPLEVSPAEKSDEIEFSVALLPADSPQGAWAACVREGRLVITNERGDSKAAVIAQEDLLAILRGSKKIDVSAQEWRNFLHEGGFTAQLFITIACSNTLVESNPTTQVASNPVRFSVERRLNVIRDEIFALNPYDSTNFTFDLDYERVQALAEALLKTVADTLMHHPSPQPPDALVLISGHACVLGDEISKFYNLGLSFARALFLRNLLTEALFKKSGAYDLRSAKGAELCQAKQLVAKLVRNKEAKALIENCFQATNGKALEQDYENYLARMIRQQVRHFPEPGTNPAGVPDSAAIREKIESIKSLLPGNVLTVTITRGAKKVDVHFVAIGFGATVPFYRHFTLKGETKAAFQKLGYEEKDMPTNFFGEDHYPSGRLMNRRVEVNVIW